MAEAKFSAERYGVSVLTWGTQSETSNGMINFIDQQLFGGDVGHSSINLTLPITEQTIQWIEKYCCATTYKEYEEENPEATFDEYIKNVSKDIPVKISQTEVRKAEYNEQGKVVATTEPVHKEVFFEVDFSWWPGRLQTFENDMVFGREGKHVEYTNKWKDYLQPEQRLHRGKLGSKLMNYAPSSIIHQRDLPDFVAEQLKKKAELNKLDGQLDLLSRISDKVNDIEESQLSTTMKLMFKNIGVDVDELIEEYHDTHRAENQNPETFRTFVDTYVYRIKQRIREERKQLEEEIEQKLDFNSFNRIIERYESELEYATGYLDFFKSHNERIDQLFELIENEESASISYSSEIKELLDGLHITKDSLKLENSTLSTSSVQSLLQQLDEQIVKQQQIDKSKNNKDAELIQKYDNLYEKYKDDQYELENILWEKGIEEEDIKDARQRLTKPDSEAHELQNLKKVLEQHKDTDIRFTDDLGQKLDKSLTHWRSYLESSCQTITPESVIEIRRTLTEDYQNNLQTINKYKDLIEEKKEKLEKAKTDVENYKQFAKFFKENESLYSVFGVPPHHQVKLPFAVNGKQGLNPESMLKKMHEIGVLDDEKFDLYRKNCSLTSIQILMAGAENNLRLRQIMGNKALGFHGTPQQVLANAEMAKRSIKQNQSSSFLTLLFNARPLDQAMGYAIKLYMHKDASRLQKTAGIALGILVGIAKMPFIIVRALLNPKKAFDNLTNTLKLAFNRDSTALKAGLSILAAPALVILAPLAAIQTGIQKVLKINIFRRKPKESADVIDTPIGEQKEKETSSSYNTFLARKINEKVAANINENTISVNDNKNPIKILESFDRTLKENPDKVVVLNKKAQSHLYSFFSKSQDPGLKKRFYNSCDESLARVKHHQPQTKEEIYKVVEGIRESNPKNMK